MSIQRFARVLWYALATPGTHVPAVYGIPGGGKTTVAKAIGASLGCKPEDVLVMAPAQHDPEDLGAGWKVYVAGVGLVAEPLAAINRLCEAERGLLIIDEAGNADRARQAALLRTLNERAAGDRTIPERVKLLVITNPPSTGTDAHEFALAFSNRLNWIKYPALERAEHARYIRNRCVADDLGFPKPPDPAAWWAQYDKTAAGYAAFVERHPHAVLEEDPDSEEVLERWPLAYASGRSMETAVRLATTTMLHDDQDALVELLCGTVGEPQGTALATALGDLDIVPFDDIAADPRCWSPKPGRADRTFTQVQYVVACATAPGGSREERVARWDAGLAFVGRVAECGESMSLCVPAAQELREKQPAGATITKHAAAVVAMKDVFKAAGWTASAAPRRSS